MVISIKAGKPGPLRLGNRWSRICLIDSSDVQSLLIKTPDRVALWSAVFNSVNGGLEVSRRAFELLGLRARLVDIHYLSGNALALMRRMELPRDWWFNVTQRAP